MLILSKSIFKKDIIDSGHGLSLPLRLSICCMLGVDVDSGCRKNRHPVTERLLGRVFGLV